MDAESVDAIVCDPPYGLEFMGKEWDRLATGRGAEYASGGSLNLEGMAKQSGRGGAGPKYVQRPAKRCGECGRQAWSGNPCQCDDPRWVLDNSPLYTMQEWHHTWAVQALRVLKPGGHLLAFGGTRTAHRLVCAVEDAGFEIRDTIAWLYGSGFPKSLNGEWGGTALKPAHEPIVVARKPLAGTVAANVQEHGVGGLNIDATRIEGAAGDGHWTHRREIGDGNIWGGGGRTDEDFGNENPAAGRWPANVVLDEEAARLLDAQTGDVRSAGLYPTTYSEAGGYGGAVGNGVQGPLYEDTGGASRFFYTAKAGRDERSAGVSHNAHPT